MSRTHSNSDIFPKFIAVDFFCGAGGTARGLIEAGGHVLAGIDKEGETKETFEHNNVNSDGSNAIFIQKDIFAQEDEYPDGQRHEIIAELNTLIADANSKFPDTPLLFSICAPCQPFTGVTRIDLSDERSEARIRDQGLLSQSLAYIDEFKPQILFCENVAGIQAEKYGGVWQHFMAEIEKRGFIVGSDIIDTVNYGIPQSRKRSIMIAIHKDFTDLQSAQSFIQDDRLVLPKEDEGAGRPTVKETLDKFPPLAAGERHPTIPNHQTAKVQPINIERLKLAQPGGKNDVYDNTPFALNCHLKIREKAKADPKARSASGFSDMYTRLSPDRHAPTITTKCISFSNGRYGHYDPKQLRALSVREAAALQSFPDDYEFIGKSITHTARMVGNAVPPKLATFFANFALSLRR
ncbi:DNA cytosine methyltransferase [Mesorhizobium sp. SP-1A]|uniref:DNA cytosine methyltransferase n=1 Tax=Mesorhizobium sp. SP-1A TaxID=3077840 RepID=UPI0028F6DEB5|nr:DNA cytosine methyltransferase [Mesorhizobium sp. SP-1A]